MPIPSEWSKSLNANAIRAEFELARAICEYGVRQNIAGFTLSGLQIPRVLQTWSNGATLPPVQEFALEMVIFQEHLGDRLAALSRNRRILEEIWRFNEVTRDFRELELTLPKAARGVLDHMAELVNGLFAQDLPTVLRVFERCQSRRFEFVDEISSR
ncbi:hypothetical protein GHK29_32100 [Sinorhizobium medicae]|uniref:hypothetical protein n=1 Tax=Sinorhizobium medicae TaxID=110321 RepID=UPI0012962CBF|nr:hypothetical protein [Sinorhizobium medicae]MDX1017041.1 hypothetical protein [Sinorhizobium medicae]MDX2388156.1 hypothetical protein [Sinorhizobium medicae]MQU79139.1 hypothetical protein [Sinorhizobium medicae]